MANQLGVQTLVSPAMCGDIGDLLQKGLQQWMGQLGVQGAGRPVGFLCLFKGFCPFFPPKMVDDKKGLTSSLGLFVLQISPFFTSVR